MYNALSLRLALPVPVAAIVASARSLGCQCDTEMPTGRRYPKDTYGTGHVAGTIAVILR